MDDFFKIEEYGPATGDDGKKLIKDHKLFGFDLSNHKEAYLFLVHFPKHFSVYGLLEYYYMKLNEDKDDDSIFEHRTFESRGMLRQVFQKIRSKFTQKQDEKVVKLLDQLKNAQMIQNEFLTTDPKRFKFDEAKGNVDGTVGKLVENNSCPSENQENRSLVPYTKKQIKDFSTVVKAFEENATDNQNLFDRPSSGEFEKNLKESYFQIVDGQIRKMSQGVNGYDAKYYNNPRHKRPQIITYPAYLIPPPTLKEVEQKVTELEQEERKLQQEIEEAMDKRSASSKDVVSFTKYHKEMKELQKQLNEKRKEKEQAKAQLLAMKNNMTPPTIKLKKNTSKNLT